MNFSSNQRENNYLENACINDNKKIIKILIKNGINTNIDNYSFFKMNPSCLKKVKEVLKEVLNDELI